MGVEAGGAEGLIRVLHEIGVPVAIISSAVVFGLLRSFNPKIAIAAAILTLTAVAAYIPIELYPKWRDATARSTLAIQPQEFFALSKAGDPVSVVIELRNGESIIDSKKSLFPENSTFKSRALTLVRNKDEGDPPFSVLGSDFPLGTISRNQLNAAGLQIAGSPTDKTSSVLLRTSGKVTVGHEWSIDTDTVLGRVTLRFTKFSGQTAFVSLSSNRLPDPQPKLRQIKSKEYDSFTFDSNYEVEVLVRDANFSETGNEWARFTVISALSAQ